MMTERLMALWLLLLAVVGGCGGAGGIEGSGAPISVAPNKITSSGAVTAKGSIFVNGVEYDVAGAAITVDGDPAGESDLEVGQIVIVEGELNGDATSGDARRVTIGIAVAGPVSAVDLALNQIIVLGQRIEIDPATLIEPSEPDQVLGGLEVGDDVEVSGFATSTGLLSARRIAARQPGTSLKVIGYVDAPDENTHRFSVNGQVVDYGSATLKGLEAHALDGAPVRIVGDELDDGVLVANEVTFRDLRLPGAVGDAVSLQGWVTRFNSDSDFDVDGHPVVTTAATRLEGTNDAQLGIVRLDAFLAVTGRLIDNGVVQATLIETNNVVALDSVIADLNAETRFVSAALVPWAGPGCQVDDETAISIDGLPAEFGALKIGDTATIYAHYFGDSREGTQGATCQIIAVDHNIRGPIESLPEGSASMMVMGQRVWLDSMYYKEAGVSGLSTLRVGDMVEVSGHTTAEGDILMSGIHAASGEGDYQVIGFAHAIDVPGSRFELGELLVDFTGANVGGFPGGTPADGDRVLVRAETAPSGGLLQAEVIRYAADIPRGATANFLTPVGLLTRFVSAQDLDIEGRRMQRITRPLPDGANGVFRNGRCDIDKLHPDVPVSLLTVGNWPGLPPVYWAIGCPPGRQLDGGLLQFGVSGDALEITAPVESVDLANRSFQIGGVNVMLHPASLLTRFEESPDSDGTGTTFPVFLEDLIVGELAYVAIKRSPVPGVRIVDSVWLDDAVWVPQSEIYLEAPVESLADPDVILYSGVRVHVTGDTQITGWECDRDDLVTYSPAEFFDGFHNRTTRYGLQVGVTRNGDEYAAESITWDLVCPY